MQPNPHQKPNEGDATTGLSPVQIGAVLGLAALGWMIVDWLRSFT